VQTKVNATYAYILYLSTIVLWSGAELFQRLSSTREGALFWSVLASMGWILLPVALVIFVVMYVRKEHWLRNPVFLFFLAVTAIGFLFLNLTTDAFIPFTQGQLVLKSWGFNSGVETQFPYFLVWTEAMNVLAIGLLIGHIRRVHQPNEKKQGILFIVGFLIPMIIGSTTDAVLPLLGFDVYPSLTALTAVTACIITYAIIRYGLLIFSPITIASNILETMQEVLIVVNPSYVIEYANQRAEELLLFKKDDLNGRHVDVLFKKYPQVKKELLGLLRMERFAHLERAEVITNTGELVPVSISAARVSSESGEIKGYILSLTDITALDASVHELREKVSYINKQNKDLTELGKLLEQEKSSVERQVKDRTKELSKSRAQLMASINSLEMGFVMVNPKLDVVVMNGAASHLLSELQLHAPPSANKKQREDSLGDIEKKFGDGVKLQEAARSCIENGGSSELTEVLVGSRYFHMYVSPMLLDEKVIGVVILIQDVTEQNIADRSRDEFFSIASHELRTPLTAIVGYTALIKSLYVDQKADKRLEHMVEGITEGSSRMTRIVKEFLDMSRLEQGKLTFETEVLDAGVLMDEVALEMEQLIQEKGLGLFIHKPTNLPAVTGDRDRIQEVFINLIGNAVKFTQKGKIILSVEVHRDTLEFRVHDTGHGILKANQALLFRKFQQAGSSLIARESSIGTGLGLYISKLMVEGMGGVIALESSAPGHGSTFSFTLPRA
jgi:PAS domain S-box-containing protein